MKTKHTPGPWKISNESASPLINSDAVGIGYFGNIAIAIQRDSNPVHGGGISKDTALANAKLIAAAPEMLELLKQINSALEYSDAHCHLCIDIESIIQKATA